MRHAQDNAGDDVEDSVENDDKGLGGGAESEKKGAEAHVAVEPLVAPLGLNLQKRRRETQRHRQPCCLWQTAQSLTTHLNVGGQLRHGRLLLLGRARAQIRIAGAAAK